jgi:hypothetical protein
LNVCSDYLLNWQPCSGPGVASQPLGMSSTGFSSTGRTSVRRVAGVANFASQLRSILHAYSMNTCCWRGWARCTIWLLKWSWLDSTAANPTGVSTAAPRVPCVSCTAVRSHSHDSVDTRVFPRFPVQVTACVACACVGLPFPRLASISSRLPTHAAIALHQRAAPSISRSAQAVD